MSELHVCIGPVLIFMLENYLYLAYNLYLYLSDVRAHACPSGGMSFPPGSKFAAQATAVLVLSSTQHNPSTAPHSQVSYVEACIYINQY